MENLSFKIIKLPSEIPIPIIIGGIILLNSNVINTASNDTKHNIKSASITLINDWASNFALKPGAWNTNPIRSTSINEIKVNNKLHIMYTMIFDVKYSLFVICVVSIAFIVCSLYSLLKIY